MFAVKIEGWRILGISAKTPKTKRPARFAATKTNVADDAIEVVVDSTTPG